MLKTYQLKCNLGTAKTNNKSNQTKTNKDHVGLTYIGYVVIHDFTGIPQTADWFVSTVA